MSYLRLAATAFALLAVTSLIWASESDELREKARAVEREAVELAQLGRKQEAANLEREANMLLEKAEQLEHDRSDRHPEITILKRRLETLRRAEKELEETSAGGEQLKHVRSAAGRIEAEIRHLSRQPHDPHAVPHDEIARRLEHMRIAVEHLNHAGLHDVAEHVAERSAAAERELHERATRHEGDVMHEIMRQLEELRHEIGRLRDDMTELRKVR